MTTQHQILGLVAGDDWELAVEMLDEDGAPFDLSTASVMWCLTDRTYQRVIDTADVGISVLDPPTDGKALIQIPAAKTSPLHADIYFDILRIVTGGVTSTLLYGQVNVMADPWAPEALPTQLIPTVVLKPLAKTRPIMLRVIVPEMPHVIQSGEYQLE